MLIANYKLVRKDDTLQLEEIDCTTKRKIVKGYSYVQSFNAVEGCMIILIKAADERELKLAKAEILRTYASNNA